MTTDRTQGPPVSLRLARAASVLGVDADDILQQAQDGHIRLCIKGGGRTFSAFINVPGDKHGEFSVRPEGALQVYGELLVDPMDISAILATGTTRLGAVLVDCDDATRFLLPVGGFKTMTVQRDDLWIRQADMPATPAPAFNPARKETIEARQKRRLRTWRDDFQGDVIVNRNKYQLQKCHSGDFKKFIERLVNNKEHATDPKTVRGDLRKAAERERNSKNKGASVFQPQ